MITNKQHIHLEQIPYILDGIYKAGVVQFAKEEKYIWASGIHSPIYCDYRILVGHVEFRQAIVDALCAICSKWIKDTTIIVGTAVAGIPWAMAIAQKMNLSMGYVRKKAKDHGTKSMLEGYFPKGASCIIIEDTISTGMSLANVAQIVSKHHITIDGIACLYSYGFRHSYNVIHPYVSKNSCAYNYVINFEKLCQKAVELGIISDNDIINLNAWHQKTDAYLLHKHHN